jgi:hypothetical protein
MIICLFIMNPELPNNAATFLSHPKVGAHYRTLVAEENLLDAN